MMRRLLLCFSIFTMVLSAGYGQGEFKTLWDTGINSTIVIPVYGTGQIDYTWETVGGSGTLSGSGSLATSNTTSLTNLVVTSLPLNRQIRIEIEPQNLKGLQMGFTNSATSLIEILEWGSASWINLEVAFAGTALSGAGPVDIPNLSATTTMLGMFAFCSNFNYDISQWVVSSVVDMRSMFYYATNFNQDISQWDVSNVTDMQAMFLAAENFNSDLSQWDVSNVTDMLGMFNGAFAFNQDLSNWDLSSVIFADQMLASSGLSCENYSNFLVGQANNPNLPSGITFGAVDMQYGNDAITARNTLINTKGWTITGDSPSGFNCLSVPLPVELLNFSVHTSPQGHQAIWSTSSELNNSHFILEHSLGDDSFEELGRIEGKGTSSKANNYEYMHATSEPGVHYYRLRQVDFDGASALSDVVAVSREGALVLSVYPNPADQTLTLQGVAEGDQFVLSDALGRVVLAGKYNGNELAIDQLPAGTYIVQVGDAGVAKRFVKL